MIVPEKWTCLHFDDGNNIEQVYAAITIILGIASQQSHVLTDVDAR